MKMIFHVGRNQNMEGAALLIPDKTVFRYRRIPKDKGGYCVLINFQYNKKDKPINPLPNIWTKSERNSTVFKGYSQ